MVNSTILFRSEFAKLLKSEREELLVSIIKEYPKFSLIRFERFERFGMQTDTAVYAYDGKEFVFVPGDTVVLGWNSFVQGMDEKTRTEMEEVLGECGVEDLDTFLKSSMSSVRIATISPMLVEREVNDIGWRNVPLDSKELEKFKKDIENFYKETYVTSTIYKKLRMSRMDNQVVAAIYEPISYNNLISKIKAEGFNIPTEDEWEYLCSGGSRTLFRWGDSFDYEIEIRNT